jgi:hypothetical protein
MATNSSQVDFMTFYYAVHTRNRPTYELRSIVACVHHTRAPTSTIYTTSICTPGIGTGEAGYLHGVWASRSPVTALVVAHTPIISRVLDIPSPLSASSFWVRVRVSVRRCYRFSGLYAFHLSGDVAVGIRRPMIAVLMAYNATASSTLALLQCAGHWGATSARKAHLRIALEDEVRRGVGPRLLVRVVRLLVLSDFGSLARWVRRSIPPLTPHCTALVAQSSPNPLSWDLMLRLKIPVCCYF